MNKGPKNTVVLNIKLIHLGGFGDASKLPGFRAAVEEQMDAFYPDFTVVVLINEHNEDYFCDEFFESDVDFDEVLDKAWRSWVRAEGIEGAL